MKKSKGRFQWVGIMAAIFAVAFGSNLLLVHFVAAQQERMKQVVVQEEYELETITVTAQKREENVQDVPMSMSVFSDIQLEDADIRDTLELTRFAPNVYMKYSTAGNIIVFRGISAFDTSIYSPAGFYVDDVCHPLHYMHNPDLFDIERVEVLKGPQGTLYGRNSESGVVNIITKQPDNELRGKIFGEYGNYDTSHGNIDSYRTGGNISGPLIRDKLYLRLAGQWEDSDGFMKNEYNNDDGAGKIDHKNGRATLRWTPTDRWDITLIGDIMDDDDGKGYYRFFTGTSKTDRHGIAYDGENYWQNEGDGQTLRVKYEGNVFNLLSLTGRRYYVSKRGSDFDCTPAPFGNNIFEFENDILSEEVRVSSPKNSGPFQWLVGLYGVTEDTDVDFDMQRQNQAMRQIRNTEMDIDGYAIFSQGTYTFFDQLHLTAGMRYDHLDLEGEQEFISANSMKKYNKGLDYDEVLPKFSLAYDFTHDIMSYASVSKGYLAGGYSYNFATGPENFTYDPEYTRNYEIGVKTSWLDKKLKANLSLFYIDIEDKQVTEYVPGVMGARKITNAAEAHSQGVELELQARPVTGLDLIAGFGYTDTEIDDWVATEFNKGTSQFEQYNYKGNDLPNAPKDTFNLGLQYRHQSGFFGRADLLGIGDFYFDAKNKLKESAYQIVNLRMGYEGERFDIIFWCKNMFDEEFETVKMDWGGNELGQDGEPRMFGARMTYRF